MGQHQKPVLARRQQKMTKLFLTLLAASLLCLLSSLGEAIQDDSLVLYLPFDEGSGKVVKDFSQYNNEVTFKGEPQWGKGKFGSALQFDGGDDYIEVPDSDSLHVKGALTVEIWFYKVDEWENRYAKLETKGDIDSPLSWWLSQGPKEYPLYFGIRNADETYEQAIWNEYPTLNEWHHVAGVYDGQDVKLYLDGDLKVTSNPIEGDVLINKDTLRIGWGYRTEFFNGILDEARIWSRALSQNEIKANMKKGKEQIAAVHSQGKLTTTWSAIKEQ